MKLEQFVKLYYKNSSNPSNEWLDYLKVSVKFYKQTLPRFGDVLGSNLLQLMDFLYIYELSLYKLAHTVFSKLRNRELTSEEAMSLFEEEFDTYIKERLIPVIGDEGVSIIIDFIREVSYLIINSYSERIALNKVRFIIKELCKVRY
jgi:hypothetical protein